MLKVLVNGCLGKMGMVLSKCVMEDEELELVCGVSQNTSCDTPFKIYPNCSYVDDDIDIIIDFSHPLALDDVLSFAINNKKPLVIATTGYNEDELLKIKEASKIIPIFHSSNMSLGINVLIKLVKDASKMLNNFDIEIIEKHHNKKVDSPSGTALMIASSIKDILPNLEYCYGRCDRFAKRSENELGIHAIRGGSIVGEHTIIFAGHDEVVEIKHDAQSKDIFAKGSISAAKYLVKQNPGYYNMDNMLS